MNSSELRLVGDIGGTNARFALVGSDGTLTHPLTLRCQDYTGAGEALAAYLAKVPPGPRPVEAALAIACPVLDKKVAFTNLSWTFSADELRAQLGLRRLRLINDFAANALAITRLQEEDRQQVGGGTPVPSAPAGIIGPGTGLGVSALIRANGCCVPIEGEGGHVTMAAVDAREAAVLGILRRRFAHVSAERVLSGPGLVNLYTALCELEGVPAEPLGSMEISDPENGMKDPRVRETLEMFFAMLGTAAGNLALTLGARGGIYIAGGIVPRRIAEFAKSAFRERFEAKGRFRSYLAAIPTYVITHPFATLLGATVVLDQP